MKEESVCSVLLDCFGGSLDDESRVSARIGEETADAGSGEQNFEISSLNSTTSGVAKGTLTCADDRVLYVRNLISSDEDVSTYRRRAADV